eukprot:GILI01002397.1.p1 GENE.GILI01002397.1~~GILI01002397.1.p1  ORF type:complete len:919 (+),score=177.58 GILI01002397.1:77-2833(+)
MGRSFSLAAIILAIQIAVQVNAFTQCTRNTKTYAKNNVILPTGRSNFVYTASYSLSNDIFISKLDLSDETKVANYDYTSATPTLTTSCRVVPAAGTSAFTTANGCSSNFFSSCAGEKGATVQSMKAISSALYLNNKAFFGDDEGKILVDQSDNATAPFQFKVFSLNSTTNPLIGVGASNSGLYAAWVDSVGLVSLVHLPTFWTSPPVANSARYGVPSTYTIAAVRSTKSITVHFVNYDSTVDRLLVAYTYGVAVLNIANGTIVADSARWVENFQDVRYVWPYNGQLLMIASVETTMKVGVCDYGMNSQITFGTIGGAITVADFVSPVLFAGTSDGSIEKWNLTALGTLRVADSSTIADTSIVQRTKRLSTGTLTKLKYDATSKALFAAYYYSDSTEIVLSNLFVYNTECAAGTTGANPNSRCGTCNPGFYSNIVGSITNATCLPCPQNTYSDGSLSQCLACSNSLCKSASASNSVPLNFAKSQVSSYPSKLSKFVQITSSTVSTSSTSLSFDADPNYIYVVVAFVPFFVLAAIWVIFRLASGTNSRFDRVLTKLDMFEDSHNTELWDPVIKRKSSMGGFLTVGVICGMLAVLMALIYQAYKSTNTENTQTSILPGSPTTSYGTYTFSTAVAGLPSISGLDLCVASTPTNNQTKCNMNVMSFSHNLISSRVSTAPSYPQCSWDSNARSCNVTWQCTSCILPLARATGSISVTWTYPYLLLIPQVINYYVNFPSVYDNLNAAKIDDRGTANEASGSQSWVTGSTSMSSSLTSTIPKVVIELLSVPTVSRRLDSGGSVVEVSGQQEVVYHSSTQFVSGTSAFGSTTSIDQTSFTVAFSVSRASGFFHVLDVWYQAFNVLTFLSNVSALFGAVVAFFAYVLGKVEGKWSQFLPQPPNRKDSHTIVVSPYAPRDVELSTISAR